jgi:hypothetical protein
MVLNFIPYTKMPNSGTMIGKSTPVIFNIFHIKRKKTGTERNQLQKLVIFQLF